jgi:thiamine-phosphate pyrophosphorylase
MELIVISDPAFFADEALLINQMFDLGLQCFHLRKPDADKERMRKLIEEINDRHYAKISLHQHHDIAAEYGIKRLHYREQERKTIKGIHKLREAGYAISTSLHEIKEIRNVSICDYVFFSPVFDSISKKGYISNIADDFYLSEDNKSTKVIALGGIDRTNVARVREMNFDGAAVLGAIWSDKINAIEEFKQIHRLCQSVLMS